MNIVVNTRLLMPGRLDGIGWFTHEIFRRLAADHPEHRFYFLFDRPFAEEFVFSRNVVPHVLPLPARHPFLWYLWHEILLPPVLAKTEADIFIGTDGLCSTRSKVASLAVIHDLNFFHYPDALPFWVRHYYQRYIPLYARRAARLAAVSEFTRKDVVDRIGIRQENIDLVYNAAQEDYTPLSPEEQAQVRREFTDGADYFMFVGTIHPRKNIANLLRAFDAMKECRASQFKLVLAGASMWQDSEIEQTLQSMRHREDVRFTGRIPTQTMRRLLASALALTYVSKFEGFGIPIVEAFACDTPVITSNSSSMPEVAGDAALLVDPFSVQSITEAMLHIANDAALRSRLVEAGRERRRLFTWDKSAQQMWRAIDRTLSSKTASSLA